MLSILRVYVRYHLGENIFEGRVWALFLVLLLLGRLFRVLGVCYRYLLLFALFISLLTIYSAISDSRRYLFCRSSDHFLLPGNQLLNDIHICSDRVNGHACG